MTFSLKIYKAYLKSKGLATSTIENYSSAVGKYQKYLLSNNLSMFPYSDLHANEFISNYKGKSSIYVIKAAIPKIKEYEKYVSGSSESAESSLEQSLTKDQLYHYGKKSWKKRDISILLLIAETGINMADIMKLNKDHLVVNKGRSYLVYSNFMKPVPPLLHEFIIESYKSRIDDGPQMFSSTRGNRLSHGTVVEVIRSHGTSYRALKKVYMSEKLSLQEPMLLTY